WRRCARLVGPPPLQQNARQAVGQPLPYRRVGAALCRGTPPARSEEDGMTDLERVRRRARRPHAHSLMASVLVGGIALAAALAAAPASASAGARAAPSTRTTLWGVDSADPITPVFLADIASSLGTPQFFGRYLSGRYAM